MSAPSKPSGRLHSESSQRLASSGSNMPHYNFDVCNTSSFATTNTTYGDEIETFPGDRIPLEFISTCARESSSLCQDTLTNCEQITHAGWHQLEIL